MTHPSFKYAEDVLSGRILACRWVKMACERFIYDWDTRTDRGLCFDTENIGRVFRFFNLCPHYKGEWAGRKIELEPWQVFIVSNLFGWKWKDSGLRRFKVAYITVGRKNGKTTMVAPIGLYMLAGDEEPGAEVYSAAIDRDQAREIFDAAKTMVEMGELSRMITTYTRNLSVPSTMSKFEPLSADEKRQHGKNIHAALCDELHVWPKAGLWSVLRTGMGARRQPLQLAITTAGDDQATICYDLHDYTRSVLKGFRGDDFNDDTFFGIIYTLDRKSDFPELKTKAEATGADGEQVEDDWEDPKNWVKANPNIGVSVKEADLHDEARTAIQMPTSQNDFLRLRMNIWTSQTTRWIPLTLWDNNNLRPVDEKALRGKLCYGGIDLSAISDLTVWVMLFPDKEDPELLDILIRVWCPEAKIYDTKNKYRDQYQTWERNGYLFSTEGDAIDYDFVRAQIVKDAKRFNVESIAVDRLFQGYEFAQKLDKEIGGRKIVPKVVACGMGYYSMAGPCKEFESRLLKRKLNHGGNPILRFMADSVSVSKDPAGNMKPNKDKSQGKIDGIVGILLGLDRALRSKPRKAMMPMAV